MTAIASVTSSSIRVKPRVVPGASVMVFRFSFHAATLKIGGDDVQFCKTNGGIRFMNGQTRRHCVSEIHNAYRHDRDHLVIQRDQQLPDSSRGRPALLMTMSRRKPDKQTTNEPLPRPVTPRLRPSGR